MWYDYLRKSKAYLIIFAVLLATVSIYFYWRPKSEKEPIVFEGVESIAGDTMAVKIFLNDSEYANEKEI